MKKIMILFVFCIGFNAFSQTSECGTKVKGAPIIFSKKTLDSLNSVFAINLPYTIKVFVTVFADDNGTNRAATDADIFRQMQNMTNQYAAHNICFSLIGIRQINNTDLNDHNITDVAATNESGEILPFYFNGYLNVFIHKNLPGLNGTAYAIPNAYLSISSGAISNPQSDNISTLGHEVGHCLGLYHTFEDWKNNAGVPTNKENVLRIPPCLNCASSGDYLCDTPADDDGGVATNCVYLGNGVDNCNVAYNPMTNNMMGYGWRPCRTTFTNDQGVRMRTFLQTNATLNSFIVHDNFEYPLSIFPNISYSSGNQEFAYRDFLTICPFINQTFIVTGTAYQNMVSRKITLKPGTRFTPGAGGRVRLASNPFCN